MNWFLVNKALALIGPKTRIYYLLITPTALGIFQFLKHAPKPLEVNLPVTVALNIGLTICYAIAVSIRDLFCPDLVKNATNEQEYIEKRIKLVRDQKQLHEHQIEHGKLITSHLQGILKIELQQQLEGLFDDKKASEIANGLAQRAYKLSNIMPALNFSPAMGNATEEVESAQSAQKPALLACSGLIILGALCLLTALSFVIVAIGHSIGRWLGL